MATHSSVLAWRIRGTGEPGGLPSMGSHRVGHDWSDLAAAAAWSYYHFLDCFGFTFCRASLIAQLVKNLPAMQETWVQSLGWEDPLEKGKAVHSSILAWRIPWTVYGAEKSQTWLSNFHFALLSVSVFLLLCFLPREGPLAFVIKLVWWCWMLLTFAFLESFWFLHQIWRRVLLSRVFLVVVSSLSSL